MKWRLWLTLIIPSSSLIISFSLAHDHGQAHNNEPPHSKYTREINEAASKGFEANEHPDQVKNSHLNDHQGCGHEHGNVEHGHTHHSHSHSHSHQGENKRMATTLPKAPSSAAYTDEPYSKDSWLSFLKDPQIRLWTYAVGSTMLISAFPCFILALIPVDSNASEESPPLLRTLLAFGAGGLLGDAFLHLIPHATPGHSHSHHQHHQEGHAHEPHDLSVGTWVLVGFMTFFIVEKLIRIVRGKDSHGHSHLDVKKLVKKAKESDGEEEDEESTKEIIPVVSKIRVAAYLNLVADFMHNFTDGLAIGASFIAGSTIGMVTTVTVLVHEVPHEIGDFAILVQSGFSKRRAMLIQLCTALGALAGCVLALWDVDAAALAEAAEQSWALPFTAGGFIYIGTVSMIPDLLEGSTAWQSLKEILALLLGLFMMYMIAFFE